MKNNKKAFTLIELLVVVLIIGILSAIALPQYTLAVEKARAAEAMANIATIKEQIDLYLLENGMPSETAFYKDFASTELSGGEWEDTNYNAKNFRYVSLGINPSWGGGYIECVQKDYSYTFFSTTLPLGEPYNDSPIGGWYNSCITQLTDLGRKICKQYESLGWKYVDGEL